MAHEIPDPQDMALRTFGICSDAERLLGNEHLIEPGDPSFSRAYFSLPRGALDQVVKDRTFFEFYNKGMLVVSSYPPPNPNLQPPNASVAAVFQRGHPYRTHTELIKVTKFAPRGTGDPRIRVDYLSSPLNLEEWRKLDYLQARIGQKAYVGEDTTGLMFDADLLDLYGVTEADKRMAGMKHSDEEEDKVTTRNFYRMFTFMVPSEGVHGPDSLLLHMDGADMFAHWIGFAKDNPNTDVTDNVRNS